MLCLAVHESLLNLIHALTSFAELPSTCEHRRCAPFPPHECLPYPALTPPFLLFPKHTQMSMPFLIAFVLNYYTEGMGEEGKRKSKHFFENHDIQVYV